MKHRFNLAGPGAVYVNEFSRPCKYRHMWDEKFRGQMQLSAASQMRSFTIGEDFTTPEGQTFKAGQVLQLSVNPADVSNQNVEVESYLGGFSNSDFIADILSPVILVEQESAQRRDFTDDNTFELVETAVGRHGSLNEIKHGSSLTPYTTQEHGLAVYTPFGAETDAAYDIKKASAKMLKDKIDLAREKRVIDRLTTTANWNAANYNTLGSTTYWDTGVSKNPLADIQARVLSSVQGVSFMVLNPEVANFLLMDANVLGRLRAVNGDEKPGTGFKEAIYDSATTRLQFNGLPDMLVYPGKVKLPGASALTWLLGDDVILISNPLGGSAPVDGTKMATSYTFRTRGRGGNGWTFNEYIPQGRGLEKGTMQETGYKEIDFFGSNRCGGLIKNVLST